MGCNEPVSVLLCFKGMGRKRDLKNFDRKLGLEDFDALDEWGEDLNQMTSRRRRHHERHKPQKVSERKTP